MKRVMSAIGVLACAVSLAACGSGKNNETEQEHAVVQAASAVVGSIDLQDVYITAVGTSATPAPGVSLAPTTAVTPSLAPPTPTPSLPATATAGYLVATIINDSNTSPDELISIQPTGGIATTVPLSARLRVQPNGVIHLYDPATPGSQGPFATLSGFSGPLTVGKYVGVTFIFAGAGVSQTVQVPIVNSVVGPAPSNPPGQTPTPSVQPTSSPSGPSPSATAASGYPSASP